MSRSFEKVLAISPVAEDRELSSVIFRRLSTYSTYPLCPSGHDNVSSLLLFQPAVMSKKDLLALVLQSAVAGNAVNDFFSSS